MASASLGERFDLSQRTAFRNRVEMAALQTAAAVASEDPATPNHAARAAFATECARNSSQLVVALSRAVASDDAVSKAFITKLAAVAEEERDAADASVPDQPILDALAARWDLFAGVAPAAGA